MMVDVICVRDFYFDGLQYRAGQVTAFEKPIAKKLINNKQVTSYTPGQRIPARRPETVIEIRPQEYVGFYR